MKKIIALSILTLGTIILAGCSGQLINQKQTTKINDKQVICQQDAKLCPDGSYVGRGGANCEFTACPKDFTKCTSDADCQKFSKRNVCYTGVCYSPIGQECTGLEDKNCPKNYQCAQLCGAENATSYYCQLSKTVKDEGVCN